MFFPAVECTNLIVERTRQPLAWIVLVLLIAVTPNLWSEATGGLPFSLHCDVNGNDVHLAWDPLVVDPALGVAATIERDGDVIAQVAPGDVSYDDLNVPAGTHVYRLVVVRADGIIATAECEAIVGDSGVRCAVENGTVVIRWTPRDDIFVRGFLIQRDGQIIAELGPEVRSFTDEPGSGAHHYAVSTNNRPAPDFLIGECRVVVGSPGVSCEVQGRFVTIKWELLDPAFAFGFLINRDGQTIATLGPEARSFRDEAPPGEHLYTVTTNNLLGGAPDFLIGTCQVFVEDEFGIECSVDGSLVTIRWDPLPIDIAIVGFRIRRNGEPVGFVPEEVTSFQDEAPPGEHIYTVLGVLPSFDPAGPLDQEFLVGSCLVVVGDGIPGPQDLFCAVAESFPVQVQLFWVNPIAYEAIVVVRDGMEIALLDGEATFFSEFDPGAGIHHYSVFGVVNGAASARASCTVETPGPPLRNRLSLVNVGGVPGDPATGQVFIGSDTLAVVLDAADPVQGWSFGVCSEPALMIVDSVSVDGTTTAALNEGNGPSFLSINIFEGGVTMGAVIDDEDPTDVLAVGGSYELLTIQYAPGPDATRGIPYPVDFCDGLGEPPVPVIVVVGGFEVFPATAPGFVAFAGKLFLRADVNNDGSVNIGDGLAILNWLFGPEQEPDCVETADSNGNFSINIADPIYIFQALFAGGPLPPAPFPGCGSAPLHFSCDLSQCDG